MELSTHKVEVLTVYPEKHPNADKLLTAKIFGYSCVMGMDDWLPRVKDGKVLVAWVPPDSTVPINKPEFSFLAKDAKQDGRARIKAKKLRGVVSFGLLVPAPEGSKEGDNVAELLGVEHYEPPLPGEKGRKGVYLGGEVAKGPNVFTVKYDVDAFRRYNFLFNEGEEVLITEKLDGCSSRYVFVDGVMYCGSRNEWKKEFPTYDHLNIELLMKQGLEEAKAKEIMDKLLSGPKKKNLWWDILERTPILEKFCRDHPNYVVYGEIFGQVNRIKYGLSDINRFAAFDIMYESKWLDALESRDMLEKAGVNVVPLLTETKTIKYNFDTICTLAEGPTLIKDAKPGTIREGCVVKPIKERWDDRGGRINFKCVSHYFLEHF